MAVAEIVKEDPEFAAMIEESEKMYLSLLHGKETMETVQASYIVSEVNKRLEKKKLELCTRSKTSQLWINYKSMLKVARPLIYADRTGSWSMHLCAVLSCLPVFAAAGHYKYLKSAYFYIQQMSQLHINHPEIFQKFENGFHVIRRSSQFWAGLSPDLVIEQTLMRSLNTTGGLKHGSGMSEEQRALWTMSSPITSAYNCAMQEFTKQTYYYYYYYFFKYSRRGFFNTYLQNELAFI
jgi:hypothetical protein